MKVKDVPICLIRHRAAMHILAAYTGVEWPVKDPKVLHDLRIKDMSGSKQTFGERLTSIEELGYWAYCKQGKPGEIHYWLGGKISDAKLISIFAHELSHLTGRRSENEAVRTAVICEFACELAKGVKHE